MTELTVEAIQQLLSEQNINEITALVKREVDIQLSPHINKIHESEANYGDLKSQFNDLKEKLTKAKQLPDPSLTLTLREI